MRDRAFGVEIECGIRGGYSTARDILQREADAGNIDPYWPAHCGADGSGVEARSPQLRGNKGFAELKHVMNTLAYYGGYAAGPDGLHVHHDAPEFRESAELTAALVTTWVDNRVQIAKLVGQHRNGRGSCPYWPEHFVQGIREGRLRRVGQGGLFAVTPRGEIRREIHARYDLNIASLSRHGTIEIRLHEGTLEFERAEAWIRFGQAMLNRVASLHGKSVQKSDSVDELIRKLRVVSTVRSRLLGRAEGFRNEEIVVPSY